MRPLVSTTTATKIAVVPTVAIAALGAAIFSRPNTAIEPPVAVVAHFDERLDAELQRCRAVTPVETAALERCSRIWAWNRKRFLSTGRPKAERNLDPSLFEEPPAPKTDNRVAPPKTSSGDD